MAWNRSESTGKQPLKAHKRSCAHGVFAGCVVIAGGAIAIWLIFGHEHQKQMERPETNSVCQTKISERKPQIPTHAEPRPLAPVAVTNHTVRREMGIEVVSSHSSTNARGGVTEYLTLADGRKISKYAPPQQLFDNAADQVIAMLLTAKPGRPMPPLPPLNSIDRDFVQALLTPIKINDTDADDVKSLKQQVIEARAGIVEEIKKGGSVREILTQYQADLEKMADAHQMANQQIQEIRQNEGEEAATEFRNRVNQKFRDTGIPELNLNRKRGKEQ